MRTQNNASNKTGFHKLIRWTTGELSRLESESVRGVVPRAARDGAEAPVLLHGLQQRVVAVRSVVGGVARHSGADEGSVNLQSVCSFSNQKLKSASATRSGCRWLFCDVC